MILALVAPAGNTRNVMDSAILSHPVSSRRGKPEMGVNRGDLFGMIWGD